MKSTKARFPEGLARVWASRRVCFSNTVLFFDAFTGEEATASLHFEVFVARLHVPPSAPMVWHAHAAIPMSWCELAHPEHACSCLCDSLLCFVRRRKREEAHPGN